MFDRAEAAVKNAYGSEEEIQPAGSRLLSEGAEDLPGTHKGEPWRGFGSFSGGVDSGSRPEAAEATMQEEWSEPQPGPEPDAGWDPQNWFPEDATVEVWTGDAPEMAELLCASLSENHIHSRSAEARGRQKVFVLPEDEAGAREIVRQIVDGVAPK